MRDEPDADELVGDVVQWLGETNNLLVELGAVRSGLAAEDDEQRLAGPLGLGPGGGVVGVPAGRLRVPLLGERRGRQDETRRERHIASTQLTRAIGQDNRIEQDSGNDTVVCSESRPSVHPVKTLTQSGSRTLAPVSVYRKSSGSLAFSLSVPSTLTRPRFTGTGFPPATST